VQRGLRAPLEGQGRGLLTPAKCSDCRELSPRYALAGTGCLLWSHIRNSFPIWLKFGKDNARSCINQVLSVFIRPEPIKCEMQIVARLERTTHRKIESRRHWQSVVKEKLEALHIGTIVKGHRISNWDIFNYHAARACVYARHGQRCPSQVVTALAIGTASLLLLPDNKLIRPVSAAKSEKLYLQVPV